MGIRKNYKGCSTSIALPKKCDGSQNFDTWTNCFGVQRFPNLTTYVGGWKDGKRHGQGTLFYGPNRKLLLRGSEYVGEWKDDKRHGQGTHTYGPKSRWPGNKYVGEYRNGKRHGQGTLTFASGDKYVGGWKNGKKHGQGTLILPDGQLFEGKSTIEGIYENGKLKGMSVSAEPIDGYCLKETPFSHSAVAG